MTVLYGNFLAGTITDAPLLIGATTVNSAAFANLPEVASPDTMWLVLDPEGVNGAPEIVQVTAHTAAATSVTVVRAQQSTSAREHPTSSAWRCAVTQSDADAWLVADDLDGYATEAYVDGTTDATADSGNVVCKKDSQGWVTIWLNLTTITAITIPAGFRPVGKNAYGAAIDATSGSAALIGLRVITGGTLQRLTGGGWTSTLPANLSGTLTYKV